MPGLRVSLRSRRSSSPAVGAVLRHLAHGGISSDLEGAIRRGTDGAERHVDRVAAEWLPTRGGFARELASKTEVHRTRITGGVRLTVDGKGADVVSINRGRLRHRVFGRDVWVTQTVRPGFADEGMRRVGVDVDAELRRAMANPGRR